MQIIFLTATAINADLLYVILRAPLRICASPSFYLHDNKGGICCALWFEYGECGMLETSNSF